MTEEKKNELSRQLWEAEKYLRVIHDAEKLIEEIERYGIKVKTVTSDVDLAEFLDKESYQSFRNLVIGQLQRIISESKDKFESL